MSTDTLSETVIANMAIDVLDDKPLTSLSDNTVVGRWMARNFGRVRNEVLEMFPWGFTKRRATLAASSYTPEFGWDYAYELPGDCMKPLEIRRDGEHNGQPIAFEREGDYLLTDYRAPLPLIYQTKVTDPTKFPPLFARLLANTLAFYASSAIPGKSNYANKAKAMKDEAWEHARLVHTLGAGTPQLADEHDIINVRGVGI